MSFRKFIPYIKNSFIIFVPTVSISYLTWLLTYVIIHGAYGELYMWLSDPVFFSIFMCIEIFL